jgi:hypothetical protein
MRHKIDDELRERIRKTYSSGESIYQIAKDTKLNWRTVAKIVADLVQKKNEAKDEHAKEELKKDPVMVPTMKKYLSEMSSTLSHTMAKDTVRKLDAANTYIEIEKTYRESVENMGADWNEFVEIAIENLYDDLTEMYLKQLQEYEEEKAYKERVQNLQDIAIMNKAIEEGK